MCIVCNGEPGGIGTVITIPGCNKLTFESLDKYISECKAMTWLNIQNCPNLDFLDVSKYENLDWLLCSNCPLISISLNENLDRLEVYNCPLYHLDVSNCKKLSGINIRDCSLYSILLPEYEISLWVYNCPWFLSYLNLFDRGNNIRKLIRLQRSCKKFIFRRRMMKKKILNLN
jgi:hypothetical protein